MTATFTATVGSAGLKICSILVLTLALLGPLASVPVAQASGETFVVNGTGDQSDASLIDDPNRCDVNVALSGRQCTLRAAIEEANHTPGADLIHFNIPGSGVKTISPNGFLPQLNDAVTIDGYTQGDAHPNTKRVGNNAVLRVQLEGSDSGALNGLTLEGSDITVRGLVMNRWALRPIFINGGSNHRIVGNFLGTNVAGTQVLSTGTQGILISGSSGMTNTIVGGSRPVDRNLITGGNFGIVVSDALDVPVGGHRIVGNYIGTTRDGKGDLGNLTGGISIFESGNTVGGNSLSAANVIAFNGQDELDAGIVVGNNYTGNSILRNSIFENGDLGIDLGQDGRTPNDAGDVDTGANGLQNFPVIRSARTGSQGTVVRGFLPSTPGEAFTLRFFSNPGGSPPEGKTYLGRLEVTTDGTTGRAPFRFEPRDPVPVGRRITATATDAEGNTSELSPPQRVRAP
jgi:CSLREA domain-containing protein